MTKKQQRTFSMFDERIIEVEIHDGPSASHAVVTTKSPNGNGFLIIFMTFENAPFRNDPSSHVRYAMINPVVEIAWKRAQQGQSNGYGAYWSFYATERIERWKSS
jgi:hypothetical protein